MAIRNADLRPSDIPGATTEERDQFAQTLDGYTVWGTGLAVMANHALARWEAGAELPHTLTELRSCLFFEQRRRNHVGEGIEEEQVDYENAIFAAIRRLLEHAPIDDEQSTVSAWKLANPALAAEHTTRREAGEDGPVPRWLNDAASRLVTDGELPLKLREQHLSSALKDAINTDLPGHATTKVLRIDPWPRLGRSTTDIVVLDPSSDTPAHVFELKWCRQGQDKVHEAIWDLLKVALLVDQYGAEGYLVTGAPAGTWSTALCGDLFRSGTHSTLELLSREFPSGRPIWDWLLEGGYDRYPAEVPAEICTAEVGSTVAAIGGLAWEIRAVRVLPGPDRLPLPHGWPQGSRPADATHPLAAA
jgi:hypothetical protein